jgi:chemotaxis signal transduction protein
MITDAQARATGEGQRAGLALRFELSSGTWSVALERIEHVAGYATLSGVPEGYFLGWLELRGVMVPVFDLNRVLCEVPTPVNFGSRILVLEATEAPSVSHIGLLASHVIDTVSLSEPGAPSLDLDSVLQMLSIMVPPTSVGGL